MLTAETKRHIDAARDVLVGVAPNPATQIDQITYALIYKFMDDMDQSSIKAGGNPSFFTDDLAPFAWSTLLNARLGNQEKMDLYIEALSKFSQAKQLPELFRNIYRSAALPYRSSDTLGLFLKEINHFEYTHPEELGNAYEYLLSVLGVQGDAGQFRTPRNIIDFVVDVVRPTKNDCVLDPACGTGGFLISAFNHIIEAHSRDGETLTPNERKKLMDGYQGFDIDPTMVRISQVNMFLHSFKNPNIIQYDSLTSDERWSEKFDVVLANPPFMTPKGGIRPHNRFAIKSNRSEVLFVEYIVSHLRTNGRAGIIAYEPILFQKASTYRSLRKLLIEEGLIAVVSLPQGEFEPYSGVKTSILFFDKAVSKSKLGIYFGRIAQDGFDLTASRKPIAQNDLPQMLAELLNWINDSPIAEKLGREIPKTKVLEDENVSLIAERFLVDQKVVVTGEITIGDILEPVIKVPKVGGENLPILSITMAKGLVDQNEKFNKRIASLDISPYKKVLRNQLVIGFPIDEGVLGFQTKYDAAAVSPAYSVWALKPGVEVNIRFLELLLRSSDMREVYKTQMQSSVSRRRSVPQELFKKIVIKLPSINKQNEVILQLEELETVINEKNDKITRLLNQIRLI